MLALNGDLYFRKCDMHFLETFGMLQATQMVLDFKSRNRIPFIYDTWQLADFLGVNRWMLFRAMKNCNRSYVPVRIPKHNGGVRILEVPCSSLKVLQRYINRHILQLLPVSPYATAYKKGATLRENALPHVGKRYLLKMDITDFFGSISFRQVYSAAFHTGHFPRQIGTMLTTLCCHDERLPQGTPTSPALANLVMKNFDDSIGAWCKRRNIGYTRYCDDLTFSSDRPLYHVYAKAKGMLEQMGLTVNEEKTHFISNAKQQNVTSLTVNEKVAVNREYKRKLRQEVHYILTYGIRDALAHSCHKDDPEMDPDRYRRQIIGKIQYVLQIEPDDNRWFKAALCELIGGA